MDILVRGDIMRKREMKVGMKVRVKMPKTCKGKRKLGVTWWCAMDQWDKKVSTINYIDSCKNASLKGIGGWVFHCRWLEKVE